MCACVSQMKGWSACLASALLGVRRGWGPTHGARRVAGRAGPHLGGEVVLLQLPPLAQVPGPDRVVQAARPQLGAIVGDVDTAGPVRVALELPDKTNQIE